MFKKILKPIYKNITINVIALIRYNGEENTSTWWANNYYKFENLF